MLLNFSVQKVFGVSYMAGLLAHTDLFLNGDTEGESEKRNLKTLRGKHLNWNEEGERKFNFLFTILTNHFLWKRSLFSSSLHLYLHFLLTLSPFRLYFSPLTFLDCVSLSLVQTHFMSYSLSFIFLHLMSYSFLFIPFFLFCFSLWFFWCFSS